MGVHGLWKLIEPSGQMVPLESLAGKVLAVDVSIWLHQAVKGMHDAQGAPLAVAHLLILFHRLCKLLFYKIKPVFVFDGGVPALKRQTMAARRQRSNVAKNEAMKIREKLIKNLLKHEAVRHMLSDEAASAVLGLNSFTLPGPSVEEDLYKLPPIAIDSVDSECSEGLSSSDEDSETHAEDIHSIDVTSQEFLNLPAEIRHDILTELIETRKQSSWKHLDNMPKQSDSFSDFQMNRLLKRHAVQTSLEKAGKEMGGRALSLKELESLLGEQGVLDPKVDLPSKRIAQDSVTRYMLVQKDSEDFSETGSGQKFDIMNHLEEVDWSSESDTDIILKKSPEKPREKEEEEGEKVREIVEEKEDKNEGYCSISSRPTVRMTQEVMDILSVLEDKDAVTDVKVRVENLQTKIHFNLNPGNTKPNESKETKNNGNDLPDLKRDSKPSSLSKNQTDISLAELPTVVTDVENKEHNEEVKQERDFKTENVGSAPEMEEVKPLLKTTVKLSTEATEQHRPTEIQQEAMEKVPTETAVDVQAYTTPKGSNEPTVIIPTGQVAKAPTSTEDTDSSSDSENDFIPITTEEAECVLGGTTATSTDEREVSNEKSNPLTVVINPSETSQKDDLFADIFESVPGEIEREAVEESHEIDAEFKEQILAGDLNELKRNLEEQHSDILKEKGKQERLALNPTDQVYSDAQELLRLFGIPFVVAPMEAEAQCATLNTIGLTEGTITDDSDIWLFGGKVAYKNFFNQQKHVLEYRSEAIQKYFKLTREEMIKMALLVGSDYTVGLSGIGPVTALEILAAFKNPNQGLLDGLLKFRDWYTGAAKGGPPRVTLRKKIKNAVVTPGFPNKAVVEAYLHPQVDDSKEPFSWAKPNLDLIQKYVRAKLGWSLDKCNELLLPVMKKLEENTSQPTIEKHFKVIPKTVIIDGMLSKRVENAIKRLGDDSVETDEDANTKPRKKRKPNTQSKREEKVEEVRESVVKSTVSPRNDSEGAAGKNSTRDETSKIKLINAKLHQNTKVPQREMAQKLLEEKKKEAVRIFRTFKKGGKKKTRVYAKEEANLSESSSDD